jgi:hypothetical protein
MNKIYFSFRLSNEDSESITSFLLHNNLYYNKVMSLYLNIIHYIIHVYLFKTLSESVF